MKKKLALGFVKMRDTRECIRSFCKGNGFWLEDIRRFIKDFLLPRRKPT